ncbi:hypothetical protein HUW51_19480 [Adhaeribacter swui]|uniref:STAS/SEC14 domain-containing protein n=1 Tax=Adhaeribacter swui TaxID=2086471 RepID=A0A7G7GCB8_9BACT|nr:hypothetical protein [Adhaeribacter swui]QNF34802.1 hypothetical protein HUW51_19480 [Adhaeribacter swui]
MELEYHPELKMVEIRWIGILDLEELASLWSKSAGVINKYEIERILLDATHVDVDKSPVIDEDLIKKYFSENYPIPAVKKIARVGAGVTFYDSLMANLYQKILKQNNSNSEFANFQHHYEALDWLTDKNQL